MINDVEYLETELQLLLLKSEKVFPQAAVDIPETRLAKNVSRLNDESALRRLGKCILVKPDGRIGEGGRLRVRISNQVPELITAARTHAGIVHVVANRKRRPGLRLENSRESPVAEQTMGPSRTCF